MNLHPTTKDDSRIICRESICLAHFRKLMSGILLFTLIICGMIILRPSLTMAASNVIVVLDPGHDSKHPGACYNGLNEETVNLKIAHYCMEELEQYYGVTVYMTRYGEACPFDDLSSQECLEGRSAYARDVNANLLVSIHNNAGIPDAEGAEIYYPNENYRGYLGDIGYDVSQCIMNELTALGLNNRGVMVRYSDEDEPNDNYRIYPDGSLADWYNINRNAKRYGFTGIIIEHAYISTASDAERFLSNDTSLKALGVADATGIAKYYGLVKDGGSIYHGVDYASVFDMNYYYNNNPDVAAYCGYDEHALLAHFVEYGMNEGRQAKESFNVAAYKKRYEDLSQTLGNDLKAYYIHFIKFGASEGRNATPGIDTMDYSAVFDVDYYYNNNPDVATYYGHNANSLFAHFIANGINEGRQASANFNVLSYRNRYADLRGAFGNDYIKYYLHYITFGAAEGREATGYSEIQDPVTVYNGIDYASVYNYNYYRNQYADVKSTFGDDDFATLQHFVKYGMSEGRHGSAGFNVQSYKNRYADLRESYTYDLAAYYMHYIDYGHSEGRIATGNSEIYNPITVYDGIDYSLVYDYNYYITTYPDVKAAFGDDDIAALKHFITYGMKEGRNGNETFHVEGYMKNNADLKKAFENDLTRYYLHYIKYGKTEGRICK